MENTLTKEELDFFLKLYPKISRKFREVSEILTDVDDNETLSMPLDNFTLDESEDINISIFNTKYKNENDSVEIPLFYLAKNKSEIIEIEIENNKNLMYE